MHVKSLGHRSISILILLCASFLIMPVSIQAEEALPSVTIDDIQIDFGDNYVHYPQLSGMENLAIQTAINNAIVEEANIAQRLTTLSTLQPGGTGLQVSYTVYQQGMLLSVVIDANGVMANLRKGQEYTALSFDLRTGNRITLLDIFINPDEALAWMEQQISDSLEDELSNYLMYAELTPLPIDNFYFDQNGITFYYPNKQFSLLSGYSGAVQFQYGELQPLLITEADAVPARLDALLPQQSDADIKAAIEAIVSKGTLPYLPVHLGDSIPELIDNFRLPNTPDQFPGGRYFQFEDAAFRQVLILSDALTADYDASTVEGILARRMNLYGIQTGVTTQSQWRKILGENPDPVVDYDSAIAPDYGLPVGTADYYSIGDKQLMLYADENGVLYAIQLKN